MTVKAKLMTLVGALGGILARLFGGFTYDLKTLIILMAIDFITGLAVAGIFKKSLKTENGALDSKAGWKGITKKCLTLTFVLIANRLDIILDTDFIRTAVIFAYIANELISIVENAALMGIPIPEAIKKAIDIFKQERS